MSVGDEFGKSERPMDPANTRSPERTNASVPKQQWPGRVPGRVLHLDPEARELQHVPSCDGPQVLHLGEGVREARVPAFRIGECHRVRLVHVDRHVVARELAGGFRVIQVRVGE